MFASCGNADNAVEDSLPPSGGEEEPAATSFATLADAMDAINDGAEIEIGYTVYGKNTQYKAKIKKNGEGFAIQEGSEVPEDLENYTLSVNMTIPEEGDDAGKLVFTLTASATETWYYNEFAEYLAGTRALPSLEDFARKVMVVIFDPETNKYDVVNAPGFSFTVLNVMGLPVEIVPVNENVSYIYITPYDDIYQVPEGVEKIDFDIFHKGETWEEFAAKYAKLLNEGEEAGDQIIYHDYGQMYVRLNDYGFIYGDYFIGYYEFKNSDNNYQQTTDDIIGGNIYTAVIQVA